jgi:hypothetical protein
VAKEAAKQAERPPGHRARVASNGKPLVPGFLERLETRALLASTAAGVAAGEAGALAAVAAASAAAAHRTTAPPWWTPGHDRALLAAVDARGHTPAPKAAADECRAILADAGLQPRPLRPAAEGWVADQVVLARRAWAARKEAAEGWRPPSARSLAAAAGDGAAPAPAPSGPPPAPVPWDEAAETERAWDALGHQISKRLGRLLDALVRPPAPRSRSATPAKAPAPLAPLARPASAAKRGREDVDPNPQRAQGHGGGQAGGGKAAPAGAAKKGAAAGKGPALKQAKLAFKPKGA